MTLSEKIEAREAVISVIGLGYVGLPLAVVFAEAGFPVVGIDTDATRVNSVNQGVSYIADVPSETLSRLSLGNSPLEASDSSSAVSGKGGSLRATTDYGVLTESDVALICVPTPLGKTGDPDVSYIVSAAEDIALRLHPEMLIVLESTSYPGTTEELVLPGLQNAQGRHYEAGKDFFLAFSPERVDPGRADWTISNTPKVIGGVTPRCRDMGIALYESIVQQVVPVSSTRAAEMVKLLENTFRATNIGLVNEISIMCDRLGIDVWEVIEAAKTKPFGFMPFYPGPGLGGHCLPVDPHFLAWKLKNLNYTARFIQLADEINKGMPLYWVNKVQDALNLVEKPLRRSSILVLGVTYKRDAADTRESPSLDIIDLLLTKGARVDYHDPYAEELETESYQLASIADSELEHSLSHADCVLIVTDHSYYDWELVNRLASLVVDTRNALGIASRRASKVANDG